MFLKGERPEMDDVAIKQISGSEGKIHSRNFNTSRNKIKNTDFVKALKICKLTIFCTYLVIYVTF